MSYDTTKMSVGDIRTALINEFDYTKEEVQNMKGKSLLVKTLRVEVESCDEKNPIPKCIKRYETSDDSEEENANLNFGDDDSTGDFEVESEQEVDVKRDSVPPMPGDSNWHEYVISLFIEDEIFNKNPTVDGLRRVTQKLFGIKSIKTNVVQFPNQYVKGVLGDMRATVVVTVRLEDGSSFDGVADSYWANTDKVYRNYPVSIAETRAEGRALKRALCLRRVNAVEEFGEVTDHNMEEDDRVELGPVTTQQLQFFETMCKRLDVDIIKLIEDMGLSLSNMTHQQATLVIEAINKCQQNEEVLSKFKGYKSNWK